MPEDMYTLAMEQLAMRYPKVTRGYNSTSEWVAARVQKIYEDNESFNKKQAGKDYTETYNLALGRSKDWTPNSF